MRVVFGEGRILFVLRTAHGWRLVRGVLSSLPAAFLALFFFALRVECMPIQLKDLSNKP